MIEPRPKSFPETRLRASGSFWSTFAHASRAFGRIVADSAVRRLGRPTLIGYAVLLAVTAVGVLLCVVWMVVGWRLD